MTDTKIYNVLTHFDKVEQNRLRKYIRSPYFNVNETLMTFYDLLADHINTNGKAGELTREYVWTQLYEKEAFNDVRFRKLSSDLLKLVEGFLAQQIYDENNLQQASFLLEAIGSKKKLERLYNSSIRNAKLNSEIQSEKPASYYYHQFEIQKKLYNLNDAEIKRFDKSNVEDIINNLDYFYLAEKLKWYCTILSRQNLISHEYNLLFIDEIINHLSKYGYENIPLIQIYYLIYLTQKDSENETHYHSLKSILSKYWQTLPLEEAKEAYTNLLSYCIKKLNQGSKLFLEEFISLSKELLETDILLATGEMDPGYFRSAILISLRHGEYDWAENFLTKYEDKLPNDFRINAVSFNRALVYFYQKRYDKVIPLLQSVDFEDKIYNLSSKSMLMAIYYEQDEFDALFPLADAFKTYLSRHKDINEKMRLGYLYYIQFVKKLTKIMPGDSKAIDTLREEIRNAKGVASEKWLLEKLAELE
jgi:hypothetical protein